jgi:uracil-DNA glycosylase
MCLAGPDYRLGDQHPEIALMGACPGAQEEEQGRPFIGDAGTHLAEMIRIINAISPAKFPSANRDDYTLLNAHPLPRYEGRAEYDGNTEPSKPEVMNDVNIARLNQQLRQTAIIRILLAGRTPQWLTQRLVVDFAETELFVCGHPSSGAWNRLYVGQHRAEKIRFWTQDTFRMAHPFCVQQ